MLHVKPTSGLSLCARISRVWSSYTSRRAGGAPSRYSTSLVDHGLGGLEIGFNTPHVLHRTHVQVKPGAIAMWAAGVHCSARSPLEEACHAEPGASDLGRR